MSYTTQFNETAERVKNDLIATMKANNIQTVNLGTAEYRRHNDNIYTYLYDENDEIMEMVVIGLELRKTNGDDDLTITAIAISDYGYYSVNEDIPLPYQGEDTSFSLFGGDILGVFTAYNLAENLDSIKTEIIKQRQPINNKALQVVVGQILAMYNNNILSGHGNECFESWCECGKMFTNDFSDKELTPTEKEQAVTLMGQLAPHVDRLTNEIEKVITTHSMDLR